MGERHSPEASGYGRWLVRVRMSMCLEFVDAAGTGTDDGASLWVRVFKFWTGTPSTINSIATETKKEGELVGCAVLIGSVVHHKKLRHGNRKELPGPNSWRRGTLVRLYVVWCAALPVPSGHCQSPEALDWEVVSTKWT